MTELITSYGALGVFLLMVPESACIPIPSEVTLIFSGVAVQAGWMSFFLALLAATGGNLLGSLIAYAVGRSGVLRNVAFVGGVLERWGELIDRRGTVAVLIARLLPLARTFVSLPAGARRVPLTPFIALTILGSALWAVGFILVGLVAGSAWTAISSLLGRVLLVAGVLILAASLVRRRRGRRGPSQY
jgi:membrane protein DedA with SNARE-associated domain